MTGGVAWRQALVRYPVHDIPPVGDPHVPGRWHKDRASARGYLFEARVWAESMVRHRGPKRFLMVGRPRSGTTLLRRLLNQVAEIHCDCEMLHHAVLQIQVTADQSFQSLARDVQSSLVLQVAGVHTGLFHQGLGDLGITIQYDALCRVQHDQPNAVWM